MQTTATSSIPHIASDPDYAEFERLIAARVATAQGPLFTTSAEGLWEAYLAGIPADVRQHYTCHCCQRFIERYGGLVTISDNGTLRSPIWANSGETQPVLSTPEFFMQAVCNMTAIVFRAKVTGVFINGDKVWGNPQTGPWSHLAGMPREVFHSPLLSASQKSAEKAEDYITLHKGLAEIPLEAVVQAVRVLEADAVNRSEKTIGIAKWLLALHQSIAGKRGSVRDNLVWLAAAKAPPGWCHVRSTMIATLLDDVIAGLPFESIKRRWNEKMHPLQYQRPTAPPKEGNIDAANKIMEKLQSEGALARRFARLDEVTALWHPREIQPPAPKTGGGAFDHLRQKPTAIKEVELPAKAMTWERFRDDVLQQAQSVEVLLTGGSQGFYGLVTAVNPDAPPMLQWDGLEGLPRNPVSWYFWHGGSTSQQWGLEPGWAKVSAICLKPCHWQSDKFKHQGPGVLFVIEAARDSRNAGGGYFPEMLRSEYHGIRSVIEAHSRSSEFAGREEGNANGIALGNHPLLVRVVGNSTSTYRLSM